MRVPTPITGRVRPPTTPLQYLQVGNAGASAFGGELARGLGALGEGLAVTANYLKEKRDQESRITVNGRLAQFEIEQNRILMELDRDSPNRAGIDQTYSDQFIERSNALLAEIDDEPSRQYAQNQLLNLYTNMQVRAQGLENQRNQVSVGLELTDQLNEARNLVRADPTQLDAQVLRLTESVAAARGILPTNELTAQVQAMLTGLVESAYEGRIEQGQAAVVLSELTNGITRSPGEAALVYQESGGNPQTVNQFGYAGLYQFGAPQLQTLGVYTPGQTENLSNWSSTPANATDKWSGSFSIPGHPEVRTLQDFLNNPDAQQAVFNIHTRWMDTQIDNRGWDRYIGQQVQGVTITRQGLRNMIHFAGVGGTAAALSGQGNARDANGASVMDYARLGSDVLEQAGGAGTVLTPEATNRLISGAQVEVRREAAAFAAQQNALLGEFETQETALLGEIGQGYVPNFNAAGQIAGQIVGPAGEATRQRLGFLEQLAPLASAFARSDPMVRSAELREMETQRQQGLLSPQEMEIHDLLMDIDGDIRTAAENNGYEEAVRRGIVTAVPLTDVTDIGALAQREAQAQMIRATLSPTASVMTPAEIDAVTAVLTGPSVEAAYQLMERLQYAPTLVGEIQTRLTAENSARGHSLATAFDHTANGNRATAVAILQGMQYLAAGAPSVTQTTADQATLNIYGTAGFFEGMEELQWIYRDAAIAHYIGVNGGTIDPTTVNWDSLRESFLAVLPGNLITHFPGENRQLIAPWYMEDTGEAQRRWNEQIETLTADPNWWEFAAGFDPVTNQMTPLTAAPTYPDGTPVLATDILRVGTLRQAGEGLYWAFTAGSNAVVSGGQQVVIDLRRDVRRPTFGNEPVPTGPAPTYLDIPGNALPTETPPGGPTYLDIPGNALPPTEPQPAVPGAPAPSSGAPVEAPPPAAAQFDEQGRRIVNVQEINTPGITDDAPVPPPTRVDTIVPTGPSQNMPTQEAFIQHQIINAPPLADLTANTFDQILQNTGLTEPVLIERLAQKYGNTPEQMQNLVTYLRAQQHLRRDDGNKPLADSNKLDPSGRRQSPNVVDLRWLGAFPNNDQTFELINPVIELYHQPRTGGNVAAQTGLWQMFQNSYNEYIQLRNLNSQEIPREVLEVKYQMFLMLREQFVRFMFGNDRAAADRFLEENGPARVMQ